MRAAPPSRGVPAVRGLATGSPRVWWLGLRLLEDVRPQEPHDALVRVASVLAPLPAMALVVVPVDLVRLALDLERLDHPFGHEGDDALVLAAVEDQQRRLDPLGAIDRRASSEQLAPGRVVG